MNKADAKVQAEAMAADLVDQAVETKQARKDGISGTVLLTALVGKDGSVEQTRVAWSVPYLDAPAVAAVKRWRFKPATADGKALRVWVTIPVRFTLH